MLSLENSATGLLLARCALDAVHPLIDAAHELATFLARCRCVSFCRRASFSRCKWNVERPLLPVLLTPAY